MSSNAVTKLCFTSSTNVLDAIILFPWLICISHLTIPNLFVHALGISNFTTPPQTFSFNSSVTSPVISLTLFVAGFIV